MYDSSVKHKYYFKNPKSEIAKDIILGLALAGSIIAFGMVSPYSTASSLLKVLKNRSYNKKNCYNVFYRLKRQGYIATKRHNHQIYISLTTEGKKKAGRFQIDSLSIAKPKRWDRKWLIVIFDIADKKRIKREALRGFLKRLQFCQLQKSVWVHPFDCQDEVRLLVDFFGFTNKELQFIVADTIDSQEKLKDYFKVF